MASLLAALTPSVEVTSIDMVDEVQRLRGENAELRAQIGILSRGGACTVADYAEEGNEVSTEREEVLVHALAESESNALVTRTCLASELSRIETSAESGRLIEAAAREELALRCEELGRALEQRVLQAEQRQHAAVAAAQQQSAAAVAALEEQLAAVTDEAAQRAALAETFSSDAELAEAERRAMEAMARCEHKEEELRRLRVELHELRDEHASQLRVAERRAEDAEAAAAATASKHVACEAMVRQMEGQLVRLSEGFNKQVEEVIALQHERSELRASTVDKAAARSWVVTFVEKSSGDHREELLRLMADWWSFSKEDLQRVGLTDAPHPDRERHVPPGSSLADAFASFLDEASEEADAHAVPARPQGRHPLRLPGIAS